MKLLTVTNIAFESIRFFLFQRIRLLRQRAQADSAGAIEQLDYERLNAARRAEEEDFVEYLRSRLRHTPYWKRGHIELGHAALALGDIATAYASGHAIGALENGRPSSGHSEELLAMSYTKRGAFDRAIPILEELVSRRPKQWGLREELAAAYIGAGEHEKAKTQLEQIPARLRSVPGSAALKFTDKKGSQQG